MINLKRMGSQSVRIFLALFFILGCARVNLTSKEPIKLDVTMRLDIYQHVAKDANAIEDMISSPKTSWLDLGVQEAFAQEEGFPVDVQAAIDARKARRSELVGWLEKGVVGENADGFVEVRNAAAGDDSVVALVSDENKDRRLIYAHVAKKNGTEASQTGRVFAKRIQSDAPAGSPVQSSDGIWTTK